MIHVEQPAALALALLVIVGGIAVFELQRPSYRGQEIVPNQTGDVPDRIERKQAQYPRARALVAPSGVINADANFSLQQLVGENIVLLDFWTYTCINCQRTFPALRAWYDAYENYGLEIVGIHSPEFAFERERSNVVAATDRFNITWPVVMDNDHGTWNAYGVRAWPTKYLIGPDGFIVYRHIGEGAYRETEDRIRELLRERARINGERIDLPPRVGNVADTPLYRQIGTPEIYFGALRNDRYLANGASGETGVQTLAIPDTLEQDRIYLGGRWSFTGEYAETIGGNETIMLSYRAKQVNMVLAADNPVTLTVTRDGAPLDAAAGADVETTGGASTVMVDDRRLYTFVDDPAGYGRHTLRITVNSTGLRAYTFTFG